MNQAALVSALGILFFALTAAAKHNLTTLEGFETAFRRAHDSGDVRRLELLVCWDRATRKQRQDMRAALRIGLGDRINSIEMRPYVTDLRNYMKSPLDPNIDPTHVFFVYYNLGDFHGTRFPIGKKHGRFYLVISKDWDPLIRLPILIAHPE
jgi:hypothetical protein